MTSTAATVFAVLVLGAASLSGQDLAAPQTPADVLGVCLADAQANPNTCQNLRWLWLGNDQAAHADLLASVNFALNALSRRKILAQAPVIGNSIVQVDLTAYGIELEAWTELGTKGSGPVRAVKGSDCPEPYFHIVSRVTTQAFEEKLVDVPAYRGSDGKTYTQRWDKVPGQKKTSEQLVHGPWLPAKDVAALALLTGTDYPIMRADWFLANALLPPAYQKFLGIKTLTDFNTTVRYRGSDDDLAVRANVLFSSAVAENNRFVLRTPTVLGAYWQTGDFFSSVGDQDMLSNVLTRTADAHEIIAAAPNGLHHFLIVDGKQKVIDFADPNIAIDRETAWHNKLVWTGLSCMTCHHGYQLFKDDVRKLADRRKSIFALVRQGKETQQFLDLFGPEINQQLAADQVAFAKAVLATNGRTPEVNSAALSKLFLGYVQAPVTLDMAVLETGFSKDKIIAILKAAQGLDHSLVQLLAEIPVRRDQWEHSGYGQLMTLLTATK